MPVHPVWARAGVKGFASVEGSSAQVPASEASTTSTVVFRMRLSKIPHRVKSGPDPLQADAGVGLGAPGGLLHEVRARGPDPQKSTPTATIANGESPSRL